MGGEEDDPRIGRRARHAAEFGITLLPGLGLLGAFHPGKLGLPIGINEPVAVTVVLREDPTRPRLGLVHGRDAIAIGIEFENKPPQSGTVDTLRFLPVGPGQHFDDVEPAVAIRVRLEQPFEISRLPGGAPLALT